MERFGAPVVHRQLEQLRSEISRNDVELVHVLTAFYRPPPSLIIRIGETNKVCTAGTQNIVHGCTTYARVLVVNAQNIGQRLFRYFSEDWNVDEVVQLLINFCLPGMLHVGSSS